MALEGPDFYDDETVFNNYMAGRGRPQNPNEALEKPIFNELAGDLTGLSLLDLGCGDGRYGLEALAAGCRSFLGVEGSKKMAQLAADNLAGTEARVVRARLESWTYPERRFDLAAARLVLHYVEELEGLLANVCRALVPGGRFVCSIEHPVITSSDRAWRKGGPRGEWIVDGYFQTGRRETLWKGGEVVKFHRTVEDYYLALQAAGLEVTALRESRPRPEQFPDGQEFRRRQRIPLMLFFAASRPKDS